MLRYIYLNMRHLKIVLVLAIAANVWECGDTKFGGEKGEIIPRRRRCYDGSLPKRLKKRDRKLSLDSGSEVCHTLYPRVSCCPNRRAAFQILHRRDARVCWLMEASIDVLCSNVLLSQPSNYVCFTGSVPCRWRMDVYKQA